MRVPKQAPFITLVALTFAAACTEGEGEPVPEGASAEGAAEARTRPERETAAAPAIPAHERAALEAIGYVDRAPAQDPTERGVTTDQAADGSALNLYGSRDRAEALLTAMDGEVVHRWASERRESWMHVEPLSEGSVLAITRDVRLSKYDWDSQLVWQTPLRVHHDLAVREDGHILALIRGRTSLVHRGAPLAILCDSVAVLSPDGDVVETHPLLPLFRPHLVADRLDLVRTRVEEGRPRNEVVGAGGVGDVLHTNSITILHREIQGVAPAGSILLSSRTLSRIAIVSADFSELLWIWGRRELDGQHDATQLDDGHLLVFDNGLKRGSRSRVVEIDAARSEVVWTHEDPELYTRLRGGAQGLPNGNVLITESDAGHVIEVSREGELVWEFWNPDVRGAARATIYRLNRFPASLFPSERGGR